MVGPEDGSSVAAWADVALGLSDSCASQYSIAEICEITMVMQSKVSEYFPRWNDNFAVQGMGKILVGIREGIGKACVRNRQGLRKIVVIWVCGYFFGPVMQPAIGSCGIASGAAVPKLLRCRVGLGRSQVPAVRHRARSAQLPLRPSLIVIPEVGVENAAVIGNRHAGPVAMVVEPGSHYRRS